MKRHKQRQKRMTSAVRSEKSQPEASTQPPAKAKGQYFAYLRRGPVILWTFVAGGAALLGYASLYPTLSINADYTFDTHNPYNASFSVTNEGLTPAYDLRATCVSTFEYVAPPDAKIELGQLTTTTGSKLFASALPYKQRASIPCNSNVAANGHPLKPGAKLKIIVAFKALGFISVSREFNQYAVLWWDNTYRWELGTPDMEPPGTISLSGRDVHYTGK